MRSRKRIRFEIRYTSGAAEELAALRPFDRNPILEAIDQQLTHDPAEQTRNKHTLLGLAPDWEFIPPLRELRVGDYRVFYDVDETAHVVAVRAIRAKPPNRRTEDIL